jgi:hypothetical protein
MYFSLKHNNKMPAITQSNFNKDSIFEPRLYNYTYLNSVKPLEYNNNNDDFILYFIKNIFIMICSIFAIIQIFITGLNGLKLFLNENYPYILSEYSQEVYAAYGLFLFILLVCLFHP